MNGFPTKILTATDGSQHAVLAARSATDLSLRAGAELHVFHVWQEPWLAMTLPAVATDEYSRVRERWEREAVEFLERMGRERPWLTASLPSYRNRSRAGTPTSLISRGSGESTTRRRWSSSLV